MDVRSSATLLYPDGDIYLLKITTWQWIIKSISILVRNQTDISTRWNQSERNIHD
jgi:hypothetical protein